MLGEVICELIEAFFQCCQQVVKKLARVFDDFPQNIPSLTQEGHYLILEIAENLDDFLDLSYEGIQKTLICFLEFFDMFVKLFSIFLVTSREIVG